MAEGGPPTCETQKQIINESLKDSLYKDATWYVVDMRWFKQWKKYVGFDGWDTEKIGDETANPGPLDNSSILTDITTENQPMKLKERLIEELDYLLVSEKTWKNFIAWYGILSSQEPVARRVIEQGVYVKQLKVEVYLIELKLCENSKPTVTVNKHFSRSHTIEHLIAEMRTVFNMPAEKEVRLWSRQSVNLYEELSKLGDTIHDSTLYDQQVVIIEQKNDDGMWERKTNRFSGLGAGTSSATFTTTAYTATRSYSGTSTNSYNSPTQRIYNNCYGYDQGRATSTPGLCGLSNLGNTCFMNSTLQCLSNVPLLTDYFLSKKWEEELNENNPLGMRGEIARSYAELMATMWSGRYGFTVPKQFKISVGRFAPQFSGYQQQDGQELMAFLLDGLHEDLNRIKKKPYVEQNDDNSRPDGDVAVEAWQNYKKRNDSIIVDTFHGLLKSTLVCPECSKVSVTFDPFCYLSLPLPIKKERYIEVFLAPISPDQKTVQYKVTVPKMGCIGDLCESLAKLSGTPANRMVVTDVYSHKFHKVFASEDPLNTVLDRDDIFVYEVRNSMTENQQRLAAIYMREKSKSTSSYMITNQLFGHPFIVSIPLTNCTYSTLYDCIVQHMKRYVSVPDVSDKWWLTDDNDNTSTSDDSTMNGELEGSSDVSLYESTKHDSDYDDENMDCSRPTSELKEPLMDTQTDTPVHTQTDAQALRRMFRMSQVNNFGSSEINKLQDDGKPLKLTSLSYIAIDWDIRAKTKFYNEQIAENFEADDSMSERGKEKRQVIQLTDCLELFTTTEKLGHNDLWYCPQCKKHQQATKKFDLWNLPSMLVIHLKRFSYERYWRDKIDALVEFPTRGLTLKKYVINPDHGATMYDLVGVSNHYGGMGGGHYTAYAKSKVDNEWYHFDDSTVSKLTEDSVVTKASYVLVYERRSAATPSGDSQPTTELYDREAIENMDTVTCY